MKRTELVRRLTAHGWWLLRAGGNHDIYTDGIRQEAIGRHKEIDEMLARRILKRNGVKITR